jgi:hypothetical protein
MPRAGAPNLPRGPRWRSDGALRPARRGRRAGQDGAARSPRLSAELRALRGCGTFAAKAEGWQNVREIDPLRVGSRGPSSSG